MIETESIYIDWDLVFQAIGALGSLATVGAFIYLFKKDNDKQSQIDRLTDISEALKGQLESHRENRRLMFLPSLKLQSFDPQKEEIGTLKIQITNIGKNARILLLRNINDCLKFSNELNTSTPFDMNTNSTKEFLFHKVVGWSYWEASLLFNIIFSDEIGNIYQSTLNGSIENGFILHPPKILNEHEIKNYGL